MNVRPHQVVQLVQDAIDDFDQQVALLVLQCGGHEQRQNLVKEWPCSKFPSFVCDLTQSRLKEPTRSWRFNLYQDSR